METHNSQNRSVGDICKYWNKVVIVHKVDNTEGWAEVLKIVGPTNIKPMGDPLSVRTCQLSLIRSSDELS